MSAELTAALLSQLGFEPVQHSTLEQKLDQIKPSGGTAMRDSLLQGIGIILRLNQVLERLGTAQNWNFVQIVITDGLDNHSKASLETTLADMLQVGRTIPVDRCKTIIIGIDLEQSPEAAIELLAIRQVGLENCEIYMAESVNISDLFQRIQVQMGIIRQVGIGVVEAGDERAVVMTQRDQLVAQVSQQSFAVIFNLDISGSMSGSRWTRVKSSVHAFLSQTPGTDLVAGICFNSEVMLLNGSVEEPKPQTNTSTKPVVKRTEEKRTSPVVLKPEEMLQEQTSGKCCLCTVF